MSVGFVDPTFVTIHRTFIEEFTKTDVVWAFGCIRDLLGLRNIIGDLEGELSFDALAINWSSIS